MKLAQLFERSFNVDTSFVKSIIYDHYDDLTEASTLPQVIKILNGAFKSYNIVFKIVNQTSPSFGADAAHGVGLMGGETTTDGAITILISSQIMQVLEDDKLFERMISYLTAMIRHELVHRQQLATSARKMHDQNPKQNVSKMGEWEQYYSDPHEIYAMAQEIVEQLYQHRLTPAEILTALRDSSNSTFLKNSPRFTEIVNALKPAGDPQSMLPRLKKLMYQIVSS